LASPVIGEHAENAAAVLEGYKSGTLDISPGNIESSKKGRG
jgi:hypothetical protein